MEIENSIKSDNAPLVDIVSNLMNAGIEIHTMRDITRGGLATVLKELAEASEVEIDIEETSIPVDRQVKSFCGILGLDPLYMGNEGKLVCVVPANDAEKALALIKDSRYGENACIIGKVTSGTAGKLILNTKIGGHRVLDVLQGEGLPRIC